MPWRILPSDGGDKSTETKPQVESSIIAGKEGAWERPLLGRAEKVGRKPEQRPGGGEQGCCTQSWARNNASRGSKFHGWEAGRGWAEPSEAGAPGAGSNSTRREWQGDRSGMQDHMALRSWEATGAEGRGLLSH